MKKLAAILAMCIVMTSALVSCGDSDDSSSGKASTTSTSSEDSTDESSSEDASASEDKTEGSTEASSKSGKEKNTDPSSEEGSSETGTKSEDVSLPGGIIPTENSTNATVDTSDFKGGDVIGSWSFEEEGVSIILTFNKDMTVGNSVDFSDFIKFEGGKVFFGDGDADSALDLAFDGKTLKASKDGEDYLALERTSGETDKNNMDGTYKITGGLLETFITESEGNVALKVDGNKTYMTTDDFGKYEIKGNRLKLIENINGGDEEDVTFKVEGDTLTIVTDDGETSILKRV